MRDLTKSRLFLKFLASRGLGKNDRDAPHKNRKMTIL